MGAIGNVIGGIGQGKAQKKAIEQERFSQQLAIDQLNLANIQTQADPYFTGARTGGVMANEAQQALLGLGGNRAAADNAFQNYLGSTGYKFRLGQGQRAVTGSAAARGLLNSGATAKGLTEYGQNLASNEFGNYFDQLGTLSQAGLGASTALANSRIGAATNAAGVISASGARQAGYQQQGISGQYNAYGNAANSVMSAIGSFI